MAFDLENFPTSPTAVKFLESVTGNGFYDKSYVGKWLFQVMGQEMDEAEKLIQELELQSFLETATWGILYHEQKYGLPVNERLSLEERRNKVLEKRSSFMPFTPAVLMDRLTALTGMDSKNIQVEENTAPYTFKIFLTEEETVTIMQKDIKEYIKSLKPSHLHFELRKEFLVNVLAEIMYSERIHILSDFYPRNNVELLYLDGSWELNGRYQLNGYKTDKFIDFYPIQMMIGTTIDGIPDINAGVVSVSDTKIDLLYLNRCSIRTGYESGIAYDSMALYFFAAANVKYRIKAGLGCLLNAIVKLSQKSQCSVETKYETAVSNKNIIHIISSAAVDSNIDSQLTTGEDIWYLDGSVILDGSRIISRKIDKYNL